MQQLSSGYKTALTDLLLKTPGYHKEFKKLKVLADDLHSTMAQLETKQLSQEFLAGVFNKIWEGLEDSNTKTAYQQLSDFQKELEKLNQKIPQQSSANTSLFNPILK